MGWGRGGGLRELVEGTVRVVVCIGLGGRVETEVIGLEEGELRVGCWEVRF